MPSARLMDYHNNQHRQCSSSRQPSSSPTVAHCLPELTDLTTSIAAAVVEATGMSIADGVTRTTATADGYNWHEFINFVLFSSFELKVPRFVAQFSATNRPVALRGGRFEPIREAAQGWAPALMSTAQTTECGQRFAFGEQRLYEGGYDAV